MRDADHATGGIMEKVIRVGALNIVTQPHSQKNYERLIKMLSRSRRASRIRGDRFGRVTSAPDPVGPSSEPYVDGQIGTFTQIDVDGDWMNTRSGKVAEIEEKAGLSIPKDLQPNAKHFRFRFYLKQHVLIFEIGNAGDRLTPVNAGTLFERLLSNPRIIEEFGEVVCTVFPEKESVEAIVKSKALHSVEFVVHAPNPDDGKVAEKEFKDRLQRMRALRLQQTVVARSKEFILPDEKLASDLRVAATNGQVKAMIKKGNRLVKVSTTDTPFLYVHEYTANRSQLDEGEFGIAADRALGELRD